ncbi:MAG: hypothetical protein IPM29_31630 [Planctomycetes bacterium]|nr:hypothetical protein [Planctomycetota bacterium]
MLACCASIPVVAQSGPGPVSFQEIARAQSSGFRLLEQERRVLDRSPDGTMRWLTAREQLRTAPDVQGEPRFELQFIGFSGASLLTPTQLTTKQRLYQEHVGYLFLHGSLRIHDPIRAASNYWLIALENTVRLGRAVRKVAVIPRQFGIHPWILEVDDATGYPLYRGEYDATGRLVSELVVTSYSEYDGNSSEFSANWWQESLASTSYPTLRDAENRYPNAHFQFPEPRDLPPGFAFRSVRIVQDDLRNEPSVVASWTDGIDEIFVVATVNAPAPALPQPAAGPYDTYALYAYRDMNTAQFMFHVDQVRHMVIGRGGQVWVGSIAYELLSRAVAPR